jgi:hypothetical protein
MSRHERFSRGLTGTSRTVARRGLPKKTVSRIAGLAGRSSPSIPKHILFSERKRKHHVYPSSCIHLFHCCVPQYGCKTARRRGTVLLQHLGGKSTPLTKNYDDKVQWYAY